MRIYQLFWGLLLGLLMRSGYWSSRGCRGVHGVRYHHSFGQVCCITGTTGGQGDKWLQWRCIYNVVSGGKQLHTLLNALGWMAWIPEAEVLSNTLCWAYCSKTVFRATLLRVRKVSALPPNMRLLISLISCDNINFWCWLLDRKAIGWDCHGTTLRTCGNISRMKLLRNELPISVSMAKSETMTNQILTQMDQK